MDDADIAGERAEQYHHEALVKSRKPAGPVATGRCLFCDDHTADDQRWCAGTDCRDLWEKEQRLMSRGRA